MSLLPLSLLPWIVSFWLAGIGLYGMVTSRHYVHLIGCLMVVQSATYVLLLAVGFRWDAGAPIFYDHPPGTPAVDPVVQALVLTDIVIGVTVTALLLALALQAHKRRGTLDSGAAAADASLSDASLSGASLTWLVPLPVTGPLALAALLLAGAHLWPRRLPDVAAIMAALAACAACVALATAATPVVHWFGGWQPRPGLTLGIAFQADRAGASMAAFVALLFAASLVFAWGYYDETHAHFHVLMLLFMAGMIGFCLTRDLFNLFVWFEVMSVAGFALTGYRLRTSALEGALTFTVVSTLGAYLLLAGIGLVYARVGQLDFEALRHGIEAVPDDPVVLAAFALVATGLLIKGAQVPLHFWLADVHGVAPSPVSVIFSGAMVAFGLFGLARMLAIWDAAPAVRLAAHTLLLGMGAASAVVGGAMALLQRHIKRLLAFSTISHLGMMLAGLALLDRSALAGTLVYFVGHGCAKGALFMVAGVLLARCGGIDEFTLQGRGAALWPAGVVMAAGGLLLAGLPVGLMHSGLHEVAGAAPGWVRGAVLIGEACTGAAVLRVTGRVFLGWGKPDEDSDDAPTEPEEEDVGHPLWMMLLPAGLLLALALPAGHAVTAFAVSAAGQMSVLPERAAMPPPAWLPWASVPAALAIAAASLFPPRLDQDGTLARALRLPGRGLNAIHSGLVGDYLMWVVVGLVLFAWALA